MRILCPKEKCRSYAKFLNPPNFWRCESGHLFVYDPPASDPGWQDAAKGVDPNPGPALARNTDPDTSHAAASSVNVTQKQREVLYALSHFGPPGVTAEGLCDFAKQPWNSITPRLRPLQRQGLVRENGRERASTGRMQIRWSVTEEGMDWIARDLP